MGTGQSFCVYLQFTGWSRGDGEEDFTLDIISLAALISVPGWHVSLPL